MKYIFINSHPIEYFSDLYRFLTKEKLNIEVWYCSSFGSTTYFDKEFASIRRIENNLTNGFSHKFLPNIGKRNSLSFFHVLNPSIISELFKLTKQDIIICHGWNYITNILVFLLGPYTKARICLRSETPIIHENFKRKKLKYLRHVFLKLIFKRIDNFLYIGSYNKNFYKSFGIKDEKLIFLPYCTKPKNQPFKKYQRSNTIIFCGKLIEKKRPQDLLDAFKKLNSNKLTLIYIGEGPLKKDLIKSSKMLENRVQFKGLLKRQEIDEILSKADVLVLPSGVGETWGLVVNEALEFFVPTIVSNLVGSSIDLSRKNGYIFQYKDIDDLKNKIESMYSINDREFDDLRANSIALKNKYSFQTILKNLKSIKN